MSSLLKRKHLLAASKSGAGMTYSQKVIADGANHYWKLDEPSGLSVVDSVGGLTGTISGGVTLNQSPAISLGKSMLFNGTTGTISFTATNIPNTCSVEAWIKTTFVSAAQPVLSNWQAAGSGVYIGTNLGNLFVFASSSANGPSVADGNWHHIVYVLQGNATTVYIDTVSSNAGSSGHNGVATAPLYISNGSNGLPNEYWHGSLDEIAIYPLVLSPAQISSHYALR